MSPRIKHKVFSNFGERILSYRECFGNYEPNRQMMNGSCVQDQLGT